MNRDTLRRSLATTAAIAVFTLFASTGTALACKNPFNAQEANASEYPLIAQNDTGKCSGEMSGSGKPGEAMKCGEGKCGDSMSSDKKPAEAMETKSGKCGSSMSSDEKPAEAMETKTGKCGEGKSGEGKPAGNCGSGKCGGN